MQKNKDEQDWLLQYTPKIELDASSTALVIVDMQYASASRSKGLGRLLAERGLAHLGEYRFNRLDKIVPNILKLLEFFRAKKLPVIYVTLGSESGNFSDISPQLRSVEEALDNRQGSETHEILAELRPVQGDIVVNKASVSAFTSSSIDSILKKMDVKTLVFTGVSTSHCVDMTARDASDRGYGCVLVEDGCAEDEEEQHNATLMLFARLFGKVASTNEVMEELLKKEE
ncbi:MAG: cysteine hydrolase family protein [Candidatus Bathyarchaeia archaeon]